MRAISPVHHLRAAAGAAPAATVASTSARRPLLTDVLELEVGEAPVRLQPAAACGRRLGKRGAQLLDQLDRGRDRQQVGLGEVAVVVGVRLRTTRRGGAGVLVPVPRLLRDRAAGGEDRRLTLDLVAHGALDGAHRVDVLRLGAGARASPGRAGRSETFASQRRLPRSIRASEMPSAITMSRIVCDVGLRDLGRAVLGAVDRLRHDLDERHAGAVVVDERVLGALDAAGRAADVRELAGILFHVRALDRHRRRSCRRRARRRPSPRRRSARRTARSDSSCRGRGRSSSSARTGSTGAIEQPSASPRLIE